MSEISQDILDCGHSPSTLGSPGYVYITNPHRRVCLECGMAFTIRDMHENGNAVLYLSTTRKVARRGNQKAGDLLPGWNRPTDTDFVTDAAGTHFKIRYMKVGDHNIAEYRIDVWFKDFYGEWWWGRSYGRWNDLCYCRQIKRMWK